MTCNCQSYNAQGAFTGDEPERILPYGKYFPEDNRETVCVDACIADVVEGLWEAGVKTSASCCGHTGQAPIANGRPNVIIAAPAQAQLAFKVLAADHRDWFVLFWAGAQTKAVRP